MEKTLGQFIRERRMDLGLTQEQLAERVGEGVRQAEISRLEQDRVSLPRRQRLEAIAAALDVSIGDLLVTTGWIGAEHVHLTGPELAASSVQAQALEDAVAALTTAKDLMAHTAELLEAAEHRVSLALESGTPQPLQPNGLSGLADRYHLDGHNGYAMDTMDASPQGS